MSDLRGSSVLVLADTVGDAAKATPLPGPWALPFLGSPEFLWGVAVGTPVPQLLGELRREHGPIFQLQTGPVQQVWIGDFEVLRRVYEKPECSGRPVSFDDPFGNFLFLTRSPDEAAAIKMEQAQWLERHMRPEKVEAAVRESLVELWPTLDAAAASGERGPWPAEVVKSSLYAAVTRAFLGEAGMLKAEELSEFMDAVKEYSAMQAKGKLGGGGEKRLPPGAAGIKKVLEPALARAGFGGDRAALPLMVAASIGGAAIFPTLLYWICLALAQDRALQEQVAQFSRQGDLGAVMESLYVVLRRTAYSVALGPPRKVLADTIVDGYRIPEGALLFAMHPAVADEALGRSAGAVDGAEFARHAFGVGPRACLGRQLTEAVLPVAVAELIARYRLAGLGPGQVRGTMTGQLILPEDPPDISWEHRPW